MATPSNTSSTFPNDELMQADYTYTGQATYNNTGVYSGTVDADAEYEDETYQCTSGQYLAAGGTSCTACPNGMVCPGGTFTYNANNNQGLWKFTLTTKNTTTSIDFGLSAVGTFTVDCGDGGTLTSSVSPTDVSNGTTITRNDTTVATYTCTWGSAGAHTILFDGTATNYNTSTSTAAISFYVGADDTAKAANATKVASISGNLSAIFPYISGNAADGAQPRFWLAFHGATITSIPATLFANYTTASKYMFYGTFSGCTGLTSLPNGLFFPNAQSVSGQSYMFYFTFGGCTGLTSLPSDLFSKITSGAIDMFASTFFGCTGLTSLPSGLFFPNAQSVSGARSMFANTFEGCTGLTSLPSDLFSKITSGAQEMFFSTFNGCTGLTSLPSDLFFPNAQSVSGAINMFANTFDGCTGLTTLPSDLFSKITSGAAEMFNRTFRNCTNLGCETAGCSTGTGYIPPTLFAGITPRGFNGTNTMSRTFYNTKLVTTCPSGMKQYITGWEGSSTWNDKVSCVPGCDAGMYSPSGSTSCSTCPANSFCPGFAATLDSSTTQGITACSTLDNGAYPLSVAGASANTQCYTACTVNDINVEHAATASGNNYYGDGVDTCALATCVNGYHAQPYSPGVATIINNNDISNYAYISNSGEDYEGTASDYGLTSSDINVFVWDFGSAGIVRGHGRCSTRSPSSDYETVTNLTDETGQDGAEYCYCRVEQYTPSGETTQQLTAPWVYVPDDWGDCAEYCSDSCAWDASWDTSLFSAMTAQLTDTSAACIGNEITITWQGATAAAISANEAGSCTYGGDIRTPQSYDSSAVPVGKHFVGWSFVKTPPSGN